MMKVQVVGHVLVTGKGITGKKTCARLCVCSNEEEALHSFKDGDVIVISETSNRLMPLLKKASGIITENGDPNSHGAIVGLSLDIPVIIGAEHATRVLKSGAVVTIDAETGMVYCTSDSPAKK